MATPPRQLLAYEFPPGTRFEGQLVGGLERIESGGAMRIVDGVFVGREPGSGDLTAVSMGSDSRAGMIGRLLSFRLDDHARKTSTERALQGQAADLVRSLAATVEPGAGIVILLVEHTWALSLAESIARIGGSESVNDFVGASSVAEAWSDVTRPRAPS